jgi:pullulanase
MTLIQPKLIDTHEITITVTELLSPNQLQSLRLSIDHHHLETLTLKKEVSLGTLHQYHFQKTSAFELGHAYVVVIEGIGSFPVNMARALSFPDFEEKFTYLGDDLGSIYHPKKTSFKVWAPLASQVMLMIYDHQFKLKSVYPMHRQDQGVYQTVVHEDCDGAYYRYDITNHGLTQSVIDPYGKGSTRNSEYSVVINFSKLKLPMHDQSLPRFQHYQQAIIYEAHVRDLTSDPKTTIPYKGTFLGAIQSGHLSKEGHPIGFDYLVNTGITHLQLLPVNDYRTVNEFDINGTYNWGYDPYQYFSLEGSYASEIDDPYSRIRDFKLLVSTFHQKGIRVNLDVVFNHVYDYQHSVFEKVVPGYYFRTLPDGSLSNGSFCGNDVATEKSMVRKLIIDAAVYWVKTFHIDGFRFDLMGLIDIKTLYELKNAIREIRPTFMFYGEGWDMPTALEKADKGITENSHLLPDFGFFNDGFRNLIKGGNFVQDLHEQGYATGNEAFAPHLPGLILGSADPQFGHPKVNDPSQSINYVECHDNHTFYDKLLVSNSQEGEGFHFRRIIFANALIALSNGIAFFHKAQELGGTKYGEHNAYRSGDRINQFDYRLVDERPQLVTAFQSLIKIRKQLLIATDGKGWSPEQLQFTPLSHGAYLIDYRLNEHFIVLINPSLHQIQLPATLISEQLQFIFDGETLTKAPFTLSHLPPVRCFILKRR